MTPTPARIPTSPTQRWRDWRLRYLPVFVFVGALAGAATIWVRWVAPPTLVAEVEAISAEVRSAQPGWLTGLQVGLLQPVAAGDAIAQVVTTEPRILDAALAVIRADVALLIAGMQPAVDQQRVALEYERLQLEWLRERVDLAALRAQLLQAESDLARATPLHQAGLLTADAFEKAANSREALATQVAEQTQLVARLEPALRALDPGNGGAPPSPQTTLRAAIKVAEEKLRLTEAQLGPVVLKAPIAGVVTAIFRRGGEVVVAGDPVLRISAGESDRLIGFLRQPLALEPRPGMKAEIRTRTFARRVGSATVQQVGNQMESIPPALLAAMRLPNTPEKGLRVHLTKPAGISLRPGEQVDVIFPADGS